MSPVQNVIQNEQSKGFNLKLVVSMCLLVNILDINDLIDGMIPDKSINITLTRQIVSSFRSIISFLYIFHYFLKSVVYHSM